MLRPTTPIRLEEIEMFIFRRSMLSVLVGLAVAALPVLLKL